MDCSEGEPMNIQKLEDEQAAARSMALKLVFAGAMFSMVSGYMSVANFWALGESESARGVLVGATLATELLKALALPFLYFLTVHQVRFRSILIPLGVVLWSFLMLWSYSSGIGFFSVITSEGDGQRYKNVQNYEDTRSAIKKQNGIMDKYAGYQDKRKTAEQKIKKIKKMLVPANEELNKWTNDDGSVATNSKGVPFRTYRAAAKSIVDELNAELREQKQIINKADRYAAAEARLKELEKKALGISVQDGGTTVSPSFVMFTKVLNAQLPRKNGEPYSYDDGKRIAITIIVLLIDFSAAACWIFATAISYYHGPKQEVREFTVKDLDEKVKLPVWRNTRMKHPAWLHGAERGLNGEKIATPYMEKVAKQLCAEGYDWGFNKRQALINSKPGGVLITDMERQGEREAQQWIDSGAERSERLNYYGAGTRIVDTDNAREYKKGWTRIAKDYESADIILPDHANGSGAIRPSDKNRTTELPPLILSPWIREGDIVMLHGGEGLGKSMMMLAISNAIATGGSLFSWSAPQPRTVLVIDPEMDATRNYARMQAMGIETNNLVVLQADRIDPEDYPNPCTEEGRNFIDGKIKYFKPAIVWLDSISILTEGMMGTRHEKAYNAWMKQHKLRGLTIGIIHHDNDKNEQAGSRANNRLPSVRVHMLPRGKLMKDQINVDLHFEKTRDNLDTAVINAQFKDGVWRDVSNSVSPVSMKRRDTQNITHIRGDSCETETDNETAAALAAIHETPVSIDRNGNEKDETLKRPFHIVSTETETLKQVKDVARIKDLIVVPESGSKAARVRDMAEQIHSLGYEPTGAVIEGISRLNGTQINRGQAHNIVTKMKQNNWRQMQ